MWPKKNEKTSLGPLPMENKYFEFSVCDFNFPINITEILYIFPLENWFKGPTYLEFSS